LAIVVLLVVVAAAVHKQNATKCEYRNERYAARFHVAAPYVVGPLASATAAKFPPKPMVSTAEDGTMTIEPRSLIASYNIFIARNCIFAGGTSFIVE
jgi:hypothetical protein